MVPNVDVQKAIRGTGLLGLILVASVAPWAADFEASWPTGAERAWIGPEYFANRMLDWRIRDGRLECLEGSQAKPMRTVHLLTRTLSEASKDFTITVRTGPMEPGGEGHTNTWTGFLIGVGGPDVDFRISALCHHRSGEDGGIVAAIDGTGAIVFRDNSQPYLPKEMKSRAPTAYWPIVLSKAGASKSKITDDLELRLEGKHQDGVYTLTLTATDNATGVAISTAAIDGIDPQRLAGNIALVSHISAKQEGMGYWFRDWRVSGAKVQTHEDRAFGPVFAAQYTLSRGVLKMTAQMGPLGAEGVQTADLQIKREDSWQTVATGELIDHSFTVPFRVENWDGRQDVPYRIVYELRTGLDTDKTYYYHGTIRKPPTDRDEFVLAGFTGHNVCSNRVTRWNRFHFWYPHSELASAVEYHNPDMLFFSGDQVYERGPGGIIRNPPDKACVDYLYHWIRWCWAFGDLAKDRPTVCIPDDHDVYHGNIWGAAGVRAAPNNRSRFQGDRGGYIMDPMFVNAVHRTQVSHLPDPVDPEPIAHGISVYFTRMEYAGFSFGIIADRMWKSSPTIVIPEGRVVNGWFQNLDYDPVNQADVPGAVLLGERQLRFLDNWATDWSDEAIMKVLLSQTIFANVATLPEEAKSDGVVPGLRYAEPGEYIDGDQRAADCDSNGWPQTGRNRALQAIRRGLAFHIAGDQHLGSFIQYGVEGWGDGSHAFCVPSIANLWPRRWFPPEPGLNREPGSPKYTGDFKDGFGNRITVHAVANPVKTGIEPEALFDRNPGYGIVRLRRASRDIVSECWPRWVDPSQPGAEQYAGWPVTVNQLDNYLRAAKIRLPVLRVAGGREPVVQVIDEAADEVLYTLRIPGSVFQPKVFLDGIYTVKVSLCAGEWKVVRGVRPVGGGRKATLDVEF